MRFIWKTPGLNVSNVSEKLTRIKRIFAPNEKVVIEWTEILIGSRIRYPDF